MLTRSTVVVTVKMLLQWLLLVLCLPAYSQLGFNLSAGWNLLGNSSTASITVPTTFGDAATIESVWKWSNASGKWAVYSPSMSAQALSDFARNSGYEVLGTIVSKEGFWVKAGAARTISVGSTGGAGLSANDLKVGWNLISSSDNQTPAQINQSLSSSLASAGKTVLSAWGWDVSSARWKFWAPSLEQQGGTVLSDFLTGKGYQPFARSLAPNEGFWVHIQSLPTSLTPDLDIQVGGDLAGKSIPPLLGVNAGPTPQGDATNVDVTLQYKAIGITMVRTHDLYGPLDMSVMYPDRSKDPSLPSSYDFATSDKAFDAIVQPDWSLTCALATPGTTSNRRRLQLSAPIGLLLQLLWWGVT